MSEQEWLFNSQTVKIATLSSQVDELMQHLRDFEIAAKEWRKGYEDMERDYKNKLAHAERVIASLREDLLHSESLRDT